MEITLEEIPVMYVESASGPAGAQDAFNKLEARLKSLKGRRFYGTFVYATGLYRASVALEESDDPKALGLDVGSITGGKYARRRLEDWTRHVDEIPAIFGEMSQEYQGRADSSRPSIEFYRSQTELILLLPIE